MSRWPATPAALPGGRPGGAGPRLARRPLFKLPQVLYIPPDALGSSSKPSKVRSTCCCLIRRRGNILDIPLADVTRQFAWTVEQIRRRNPEPASEYLLMAAMLIEIKSRMLLPPKKRPTAPGPDAPNWCAGCSEYEAGEQSSAATSCAPGQLRPNDAAGLRFPDANADDLHEAWMAILEARQAEPASQSRAKQAVGARAHEPCC